MDLLTVGYCASCHTLREYDVTKQRIYSNVDFQKTRVVGPECDRIKGYRVEPEPLDYLGSYADYPRYRMRETAEYCDARLHVIGYEEWTDAIRAAYIMGGITAANELWKSIGSPHPRVAHYDQRQMSYAYRR